MATLHEGVDRNTLYFDEHELAVIRELVLKAYDTGTDWASYSDACVIDQLNQDLNPE